MPRVRTKAVKPTDIIPTTVVTAEPVDRRTSEVQATTPLDVDSTVALFKKQGFDPLVELIQLYRSGKTQVVTREGSVIEVDLSASDKTAILKELLGYRYSKMRPSQGAEKVNPHYTIVINK